LTAVLARAKRDYYAVLGVPRDAERETIRRAYRALAAECHPDVSAAPESTARFHEIAEAYEVLSRTESRSRYDRRAAGSHPPRKPEAREGDGSPPPWQGARGADVVTTAEIEFVEAARGTTRGLRYTALLPCPACAGDGAAADAAHDPCPACGGTGHRQEVGSTSSARFLRLTPCGRCRGRGQIATSPCTRCDGVGALEEARSLLVIVPPGTEDGQELRLRGEGNAGGEAGEPGDVVVQVTVRPAPDSPLVRRLAVLGVAVAVVLAAVTLALH
jgi:molecular chaperone DnaJ